MKIVYPVNIRFPSERANSIQVINTCQALAEKNNKIYLLVRRNYKKSMTETLDYYGLKQCKNLVIPRLPVINTIGFRSAIPSKLSFLVSSFIYILILILKKEVDIIYTREFWQARIFNMFRFILRKPVVFECHTLEALRLKEESNQGIDQKLIKKNRKKENKLFNSVDGIVTITHCLKELIEEEYQTSIRIKVIPDGTNYNEETKAVQPDLRRKTIKLIYTGQLYRWKGVETLVKSMIFLESVHLDIFGGLAFENDLQLLMELSREIDVKKKITFHGFQPPDEIKKYLRKADIAIIPLPDNYMAAKFTSPLKLFEYMAAGIPIVASDLPSLKEILTDGENAILVRPDSPEELAVGIQNLIDMPKLRLSIASQALEDVRQYSWPKRAEKIMAFLENITNGAKDVG